MKENFADMQRLRQEVEIAISKGWLDHVLSGVRWWFDAHGEMRPIRRQNFWQAYVDMRMQIADKLKTGRTLHRTLLLADDFNVATLTETSQDYGVFWTLSRDVADYYHPRRFYQCDHPMPVSGYPYVVTINDVLEDEVDWVASVCCQLGNPQLEEIRLRRGVQKKAIQVQRGFAGEGRTIRSARMPTLSPAIPEGPGFIDNFRWLNQNYLKETVSF
jgi:hypothetical protein